MAKLMAIFGLAALLVASVGLGGVVAYSAAERTREIGVRLALGATTRHVVGLVVWQGMRLAAIGIAVGVPVAATGAVLMSRKVPGVGAADALVVGTTVLGLALVAAVASWIPARRASRLAPATVLRAE
jgi:ABC-type antimicrobial peptide transport system permease subunit